MRVDRGDDTRVLVEALDPQLLAQVTGGPDLQNVADEVTAKLHTAL